MKKAFFLLLFLFLGCKDPYDNLEWEKQFAKDVYDKYSKTVQCEDKQYTSYLKKLQTEILTHAEKNPYEFSICIIKEDNFNAFALPAGYIFLYTGLLNTVDSESELAFILGHETSHVLMRHGYRTIKKTGAINTLRSKIAAMPLITLADIIGGLGILKYSRENEKDADLRSLEIVRAMKFNPAISILAMEKMISTSPPKALTFLSTHPHPETRIKYLKKNISRMKVQDKYREDSEDFKKMKKELGEGK